MGQTIRITDEDAEAIDSLVTASEDSDMSWATKVGKVVTMAHAWQDRSSDML